MFKAEIIAEIGNTHEGSVGLAKCFVKKALEAGADTVKFQTHLFSAESLDDAPNPPYFSGESRKDYFQRTSFNTSELSELKIYTEGLGGSFLSSPFSIEAVEMLEEIGVDRYKIPSGEVTNLPLIEKVAEIGKPVILSSGMSDWLELDAAVEVLRKYDSPFCVLQCTSTYPCPPAEVGLNLINDIRSRYQCAVGFSDHTLGLAAPVASIFYGASIIEKHFTLSKEMYGSDAKNSMDPGEFLQMCNEIRFAEEIKLSNVDKDNLSAEILNMKDIFEKSIVSVREIRKGQKVTIDDLAFKKPGIGLPPRDIHKVLGKKASKNIKQWKVLEEIDFIG
jgi:N,N'-diacetyllegionaminate synthase